MLTFPKTTEFNKRIPKQKFYNNLRVSTRLEELFVKEIDTIYWRNKLSPETLNVTVGSRVTEIEIIEINLKEDKLSQDVIEFIDREIPYHLVFILRYKDLARICVSYKEDSKNREGKFKVDAYYKTQWMKYEDLSLKIEGLNLDTIYENFILQVAGERLEQEDGVDLKDIVEKAKEKERLESLIFTLKKRIRNEKQYNIQVRLMGELRKIKKQLKSIS